MNEDVLKRYAKMDVYIMNNLNSVISKIDTLKTKPETKRATQSKYNDKERERVLDIYKQNLSTCIQFNRLKE